MKPCATSSSDMDARTRKSHGTGPGGATQILKHQSAILPAHGHRVEGRGRRGLLDLFYEVHHMGRKGVLLLLVLDCLAVLPLSSPPKPFFRPSLVRFKLPPSLGPAAGFFTVDLAA